MADYDVDLFVIGAGSGGVRAARIASSYGASVMIAEEYRVGGTCVIRGCVPKKLLVYASRFPHEFADAAGFVEGRQNASAERAAEHIDLVPKVGHQARSPHDRAHTAR